MNAVEVVAVDGAGVISRIFPNCWSLRSWRAMDSRGGCPKGYKISGRKIWRVQDLQLWAELGFPNRPEFEQRLAAQKQGDRPGA